MGFWTLFEASNIPVLQVLIISGLGAFLATPYCNVLKDDARKHLNKIVFVVFTPCLVFASLVQSVTLEVFSWWFMPVNIMLIYLIGGFLGWVAVKLLKPEPFLRGVVIACCSAGDLGNLMIIIIPAICGEKGTPFGSSDACTNIGLAYSTFSMALGAFYIWTHTYHMMRSAGEVYRAEIRSQKASIKVANADLEAGAETQDSQGSGDSINEQVPSSESYAAALSLPLSKYAEANVDQAQSPEPALNGKPNSSKKGQTWENIKGLLHRILEELFAPPTISSIVGLVFGAIPFLKSLIIGSAAPLRVIEQSVSLLGNATIPCITLILGGNLTKGLRLGKLKISMMIAILCVRFVILPASGILVVRLANSLGLLPPDPLYRYVLMVQFTLPPAMAIGTMAQLFNVGEQESSIIFLYTYLVAAVALTFWSAVYMWMLS